jgi:hypothetical protein
LLGVIWLFAGKFPESARHFETTLEVGESEGSALLRALGTRHLALALCWSEPAAALAHLDEADQLNRDLNLQPGIGQCLVARAVALVGSAPIREVDALLAGADATFSNAGYFDDALGALSAGVFAAAVTGDDQLAEERMETLLSRSEGRRPRTWLAMADAWMDRRDRFDQVSWPLRVSAFSPPRLCRTGGEASCTGRARRRP